MSPGAEEVGGVAGHPQRRPGPGHDVAGIRNDVARAHDHVAAAARHGVGVCINVAVGRENDARVGISVATVLLVSSGPRIRAAVRTTADAILTMAILDRLLHDVQVVHIDGRGYRLRDLDALLSTSAETRPAARLPGSDVHRIRETDLSAGICLFLPCGNLGVLAHRARGT